MPLDQWEKTVLWIWLIGIILTVGFWIAIIYIAVHFLLKLW